MKNEIFINAKVRRIFRVLDKAPTNVHSLDGTEQVAIDTPGGIWQAVDVEHIYRPYNESRRLRRALRGPLQDKVAHEQDQWIKGFVSFVRSDRRN